MKSPRSQWVKWLTLTLSITLRVTPASAPTGATRLRPATDMTANNQVGITHTDKINNSNIYEWLLVKFITSITWKTSHSEITRSPHNLAYKCLFCLSKKYEWKLPFIAEVFFVLFFCFLTFLMLACYWFYINIYLWIEILWNIQSSTINWPILMWQEFSRQLSNQLTSLEMYSAHGVDEGGFAHIRHTDDQQVVVVHLDNKQIQHKCHHTILSSQNEANKINVILNMKARITSS